GRKRGSSAPRAGSARPTGRRREPAARPCCRVRYGRILTSPPPAENGGKKRPARIRQRPPATGHGRGTLECGIASRPRAQSMSEATLLALSPLDGRYAAKADPLRPIFSEFGLIRSRVRVEVEWLLALAAEPGIGELAAFDSAAEARLRAL